MIQIPKNIVDLIKTVPASFATSSKIGCVNCNVVSDIRVVSPNQIIVADNFFNKTRQNLNENSLVALVVHTTDYKNAYQLKGSAQVYTDNKHRQQLIEIFGDDPHWSKKATVIVTVTEIWDLADPKLICSEKL